MKRRYVIIGNSIAGVSCVEGIREVDERGEIIMISDEGVLNYSRPLISYYLGGKVKEKDMAFRDERFYEKNKVEVMLKTKAKELVPEDREIVLKGGKRLKFDRVLIATGGKPIVPPIEGLDKVKEGVFTFTKLDDAKSLIRYIKSEKVKEVVVLGAGLIGLKCTEGLVARGVKVTIVELADRILANTFDKDASDMLEDALKKWNCTVIKEDTIVKVKSERKKLKKVVLRSKKEIDTRVLIIAIGGHPDTAVVEKTKVETDRGIIVNNRMETNIKNIYSAGDVAQGPDFLLKRKSVLAIWPVASRQGRTAGINMAGGREVYSGLFPMNSVEFGGMPTISFGITNPREIGYEVLTRKGDGFYRKVVLKDNRIVGAIFLGRIERAGIIFGLIKNKVDVSSFKEELITEDPKLLFLSEEMRRRAIWESMTL